MNEMVRKTFGVARVMAMLRPKRQSKAPKRLQVDVEDIDIRRVSDLRRQHILPHVFSRTRKAELCELIAIKTKKRYTALAFRERQYPVSLECLKGVISVR